MLRVSVIIPVFNVEKYLEECLESILAQTLKDIEIICVNDGSVDNSLSILRRYESEYPQIKVLDQLNGGQSAARNRAMEYASGEYVYFMDSDDLLTSKALDELYQICTERQLDILYFSGTSFFEDEDLERRHKGFVNSYYRKGTYTETLSGDKMFVTLIDNRDYYVSPCLQLLRRQFLNENKIRFFEGIIHEDNCFSFQTLLLAKKAFCVNDIYFYRRVRGASVMTHEETSRNLRGYFCCLMEQMRFAGELGIQDVDVNEKIDYVLMLLNKHVQRIYLGLSKEQKELFLRQCSMYERYLFNAVIRDAAWKNEKNERYERDIKKLKKQLRTIKKSHSYRIGRKITMPFRLIKGGWKCCRQHGFVYTCKLTVKKIIRKLK